MVLHTFAHLHFNEVDGEYFLTLDKQERLFYTFPYFTSGERRVHGLTLASRILRRASIRAVATSALAVAACAGVWASAGTRHLTTSIASTVITSIYSYSSLWSILDRKVSDLDGSIINMEQQLILIEGTPVRLLK